MAFSDYKHIEQVQTKFNITYNEDNFITQQEYEIPATFLQEFTFNQKYLAPYISESSRTEAIIFPIIREVYKRYSEKYALWIRKAMNYDDDLRGIPDYIIAARSPLGKTVLTMPVLIVVEAKRNDFDEGWGQCLAELVAAQKLNANESMQIYGIVTDGKRWEFGKLCHNQFTQNISGYSVDQLPQLFGVLQQLFDFTEKHNF
ncbi:hypothetical protein TI05_08935 [Achromatium sp. WMS3]|nr:hypothetical protein TI05_08935 [Achromatium sp. WMS3]